MRVAVVHISDIHLCGKSDLAFKRREKLANSILFSRDPEEQLFLVVSGDIADRGTEKEYELAREFFSPLLISLGVSNDRAVFVPGNHDCNFENLGDVRPRLLTDIDKELETLDPGGETVRILLQVQENFFSFCAGFHADSILPEQRLFHQKTFASNGKRLEFRSFNSAWLSRRHEEPGLLGFPGLTINAA
jgi:3',5'-cyclic AMP phosphodiesterase CpdA